MAAATVGGCTVSGCPRAQEAFTLRGLGEHLARHARSGKTTLRVGRPPRDASPAPPPKRARTEATHPLRDAAAETLACDRCSKRFGSRREARDHARSHEELVECAVEGCGARVRAKNMRRHMDVHRTRVTFAPPAPGSRATGHRTLAVPFLRRNSAPALLRADASRAEPAASERVPEATIRKFNKLRVGAAWKSRAAAQAAAAITLAEFMDDTAAGGGRPAPFIHLPGDAARRLRSLRFAAAAAELHEQRVTKAQRATSTARSLRAVRFAVAAAEVSEKRAMRAMYAAVKARAVVVEDWPGAARHPTLAELDAEAERMDARCGGAGGSAGDRSASAESVHTHSTMKSADDAEDARSLASFIVADALEDDEQDPTAHEELDAAMSARGV